MKLKFKLRSRRTGNIVVSPFDALKQEALAVARRLSVLDSNTAASRLTPEAFLKEVMALDDKITLKSIAKLRKALQRNSPPNLTHSNASLRRMVSALKGPEMRRPPPAKYQERTLRWLNTEPSIVELTRFGSSPLELFAVAVQIAGEYHPEVFGRRQSSAEIDNELATLKAKLNELTKKLATDVTAADLNIPDNGTDPVTFACAPEVPLAPRHSAGERLIAHLMARPSEQVVRQAEIEKPKRERDKMDKAFAELAEADSDS